MSNESVYLPGKIRDRIQDLMKFRKITQAELATRIGCSESMLSRFISGKTDKLGDENIIRIARVFNVSTDFLLGEVDVPDRLNYDISELGLSVQAARNLYTHAAFGLFVSFTPPPYAENRYLPSRSIFWHTADGERPRIFPISVLEYPSNANNVSNSLSWSESAWSFA